MLQKHAKKNILLFLMSIIMIFAFTGTAFAQQYVDTNSPPPSKTGYVAPKGTNQKVKVPGSNQRGWLDSKGRYWIPDNNMDGGPGWVRQYPDRSHDHVYPNGNVRKHPKAGGQASKFSISWWQVAALGLIGIVSVITLGGGDILIIGGALLGL